MEFDIALKKFSKDESETRPWQFSQEDRVRVEEALKAVQEEVSSRLMGTRFTSLFSNSKKPRTHHYFMFASPYGMVYT